MRLGSVLTNDPYWEAKGRGIAVFRLQETPNIEPSIHDCIVTSLHDIPGSFLEAKRIIIPNLSRDDIENLSCRRNLCESILLPAYRRRLPVYLFSSAALDDMSPPGSLIEPGEQLTKPVLDSAMCYLYKEQIWSLLNQMCIIFPEPELFSGRRNVVMTPIEEALASAFDRRKMAFDPQSPIGPYIVDFAFNTPAGTVVVEADGRDFHDAARDSKRDLNLTENHQVVRVIRFTGSQIMHSAKACADAVQSYLSGLSSPEGSLVKVPGQLKLDEEQKECLAPLAGVVLTLAPAGSGKTRVLARRVVECVRNGVKPDRILCVVFNVRAKNVMIERIHTGASLPTVRVQTLHSIGNEIVSKVKDSHYYGFGVVEEHDLESLFRSAIAEQLGPDPVTQKRRYVSDGFLDACREYCAVVKRTLCVPDRPIEIDEEETLDLQLAHRVMLNVDSALLRKELITHDDQIYRAIETLLEFPKVRGFYQHKYDAVLVDEFQDLTPAQFALVYLLAKPLDNLFVVGDDDQMIYSFTCADPRNIRAFEELFTRPTTHTLGLNYRCDPEIVRHSANLISYNRERKPKHIRPNRTSGYEQSFQIEHATNLTGEAKAAAHTIRQWHARGVSYSDIAVLVRVSNLAVPVQNELKSQGIPFDPIDNARFYTSKIGMLLDAYLSIALDPDAATRDEYDLVLRTPNKYLTSELSRLAASKRGQGLRDTSWIPEDTKRRVARNLRDFYDNVCEVHTYAADSRHSSLEVITFLVRRFALDTYTQDVDAHKYNTGVVSFKDFIDIVKRAASDYPTFAGFVEYYRQQAAMEASSEKRARQPDSERSDRVNVRTIHSCKGEEFKNVVLFHVSEGTLPHQKSIDTGNWQAIEEERRVFYVGMTRAEHRLFITTESEKPSRFIAELERPYQKPSPVVAKVDGRTGPTTAPSTDGRSLLGQIYDFLCDLFGVR